MVISMSAGWHSERPPGTHLASAMAGRLGRGVLRRPAAAAPPRVPPQVLACPAGVLAPSRGVPCPRPRETCDGGAELLDGRWCDAKVNRLACQSRVSCMQSASSWSSNFGERPWRPAGASLPISLGRRRRAAGSTVFTNVRTVITEAARSRQPAALYLQIYGSHQSP